MGLNTDLQHSIFSGSWKFSQKRKTIQLTRNVQVNGRPYAMKVGYTKAFLRDLKDPQQREKVILDAIEKSEKQLAEFVASQAAAGQNERFSLKINVNPQSLAKTTGSAQRLSKSLSEHCLLGSRENPIEKTQTKRVGEEKAQRALHLIGQLKQLAAAGQVEYRGKKYNVPAKDQYGRRKWQFSFEGVNYEVNEYDEEAYNGVTTEDFIKRQKLVLEAAHKYLSTTSLLDVNAVCQILQQLDLEFQKDLQHADYRVDWKKIGNGTGLDEQYKAINQNAARRIAQFARDVQHVIDSSLGERGAFSLEDLDNYERKAVHCRDRPVILNIFRFGGGRYLNMHAPESKDYHSLDHPIPRKTTPSTVRNRAGIVNYLTSYSGTVDSDGKVSFSYEAVRHSSYPPINLKSGTLRRSVAAHNVKQGLRDLAFKSLSANPRETSREDPMVLPLRSMMLLTPKRGDFLRNRKKFLYGKWLGESEVLQLNESAAVLRMYNGRTIPLLFGSDVVWVKPEISMMNLGANPEAAGMGLFGKLPTSSLQGKINAKGFIDFVNEVEAVFDHPETPPEVRKAVQEIRELEQSHRNYHSRKEKMAWVQAKNEAELKELYSELEMLHHEYLQTKNKRLKMKLALQRAKIKKREDAIFRVHGRLLYAMRKGYLKHQAAITEKEAALNRLIEDKAASNISREQCEKYKKLQDIRLNLQQAKQLFYSGGCQKPQTVMDFQALYIQTHSMLGNFVEFFCKSGEDRTGRVDDKVQERELFRIIKNRVPSTDEDFKMLNEVLALVIHQYSVSQNTTEQNSNARGEQISYKVNPEVPAEHDRLQATLAKRVFKQAKRLSPSSHLLCTPSLE